MTLIQLFTNIANAIRSKKGTSGTIKAENFANEISSIKTGIIPTGTIDITENGNIDVSNYANANVNVGGSSDDWYITDARYLFYKNARLDLKEDLIKKLKNVTNVISMFEDCDNLNGTLDISQIDLSQVTSMISMIRNCYRLSKIILGRQTLNNLTSMNYGFYGNKAITEIDFSNFVVNSPFSMNQTFRMAQNLLELDLRGIKKVTNCSQTFSYCTVITNIKLQNWDVSDCVEFSQLFYECPKLEDVDISNWNFKKAKYLDNMFKNCSSLSNNSLNSILAALPTVTENYTYPKTLKYLGLSSSQATTCTGLSNWAAAQAAGWTTGY